MIGKRLGPYEVVAKLGEGGMGEVYRATDMNLKRQVAIKVLPAAVASDPDRLARFQREAEVLAALNHPNIAQIYGLERLAPSAGSGQAGTTALVMELVEGPTLAERLAQGAGQRAQGSGLDAHGLPLDEALSIARQIAEALEAAHEQGIIHRDLKPANIKVRPDGTVKVLDFGLAKLVESAGSGQPAAGSPYPSMSPTITSPALMTGIGVILGTAAYMSPEQARGRAVDRRADIWAFGCVLFEMLAGRLAFAGEDVTVTLARVVEREPDFEALPQSVPARVRQAIRVCLRKDPRQRAGDIRDVRLALEGAFETVAPPADASVVAPLWRRVAALTLGALMIAVVAGTAVWFAARPGDALPPRVSRLQVATPGEATLSVSGGDRDLAITPDGSRVIYVGNRGTQLFVRALDTVESVAVYTGAPRGPFVSPDGQWIGFFDRNNELKKVAITGGPAITIASTIIDRPPRGATWASDDSIIFATSNETTGLQRIAAAGGAPTVLTRPDRAQGESDHSWPELLPGGRAVLFTITAVAGGVDASQVVVLDLQTGTRTVVVRGGTHAHFVPRGGGPERGAGPGDGYLVYAASGALRAVAFDSTNLQTRGTSVSVINDPVTATTGSVDAAVADDGTLVYASGASGAGIYAPRTLVWVDRQGRETPIPAPPRAYAYPRLSPDGTRLAVHAADQDQDLWMWDFARATLARLTFEKGQDQTPLWTPDGRRLVFSSERAGMQNLYVQAADGTGSSARLTESPNLQTPTGVTSDGTRVVFYELTERGQADMRLVTLTPTPRVEPLLETPFGERDGVVSPDGRWLAYASNSSGRFEIYVRPFPNVGGGQSQVSTAGGEGPLWSRNGRELFYRTPEGTLMTVPVETRGPAWSAGNATKLFEGPYYAGFGGGGSGREYDVSADGRRFLMLKDGEGADQATTPPQLVVVQHWTEELKRLVPVK